MYVEFPYLVREYKSACLLILSILPLLGDFVTCTACFYIKSEGSFPERGGTLQDVKSW